MTKVWRYVAVLSLVATLFSGFFATTASAQEEIDTLRLMFVPSRDPEDIITTTEPLKQLLIDELAKLGFKVGKVDIAVGTNYEAAGEALAAGTADAGFIPGGTFVLYEDEMEVLLTSTRKGLNKDSENPADWNDGKPTERSEEQVTYYKGLVIAGPSAKGKELAKKINAGEKLTWEDLDSAKWAVMSSSSSSGYIYPSIWLGKQFKGKTLSDLSNVVQAESYGSAVARLAAEQVDIIVGYGDLRTDNAEDWTKEMGRKASIWEETNVIGVTPNVYNDTVSASLASDIMTPEFKEALKTALINIAKTEEGKKVIAIYSHEGYQPASAEDYETEREAQRILREQNNGN
ncbi:PhnD/SsuA/transferrin family substrate-binding protein [Tuanshanicoccus lijuaniae]|uniref:phosphate/phosphite/phosphonate ABC transporter substrate-binding protein n=1 Tax=Aerococcaceae bacterium zg-1292 TaxID=2774330 RepID=UPI001938F3E6|nr:PhnD/SsuA/transferrin family substrate-binding protein [Aerococcaceae bacterium zg-1292]MBF6625048.1 PhnD/SsuA/transferrin family substrate-binding protein [Aerococcaceae bacterium zg-BR9]MBF6978166.1 PhnD/SsuA/transferrin family substrate-binding protein [Aerococcaceae bacterium zg-BR22]MBS4456302.1 PhnD/SsuA/transferrin family substrate-binding protein [Aerococcaceae bacterium zg-A91]MBS4458111.1 PhnD/SsuA/transferrin family substrate-binding protein [Aerococcaceae bacterium zg-BR33]